MELNSELLTSVSLGESRIKFRTGNGGNMVRMQCMGPSHQDQADYLPEVTRSHGKH